jgi:hypothetical protein
MRPNAFLFIVAAIAQATVNLCFADIHLDPPTETKSAPAGDYEIRWNNHYAQIYQYGVPGSLVYEARLTITQHGRSRTTFDRTNYAMRSIVGPVISYLYMRDGDAGAHPVSYVWLQSMIIRDATVYRASITDLFDEQAVIDALLENPKINEMVEPGIYVILREFLWNTLPGDRCEKFGSMEEHFAVSDIHETTATVVFSPTNNSEFCRGALETYVAEIPIPEWSKPWFETAKEHGTYTMAFENEKEQHQREP